MHRGGYSTPIRQDSALTDRYEGIRRELYPHSSYCDQKPTRVKTASIQPVENYPRNARTPDLVHSRKSSDATNIKIKSHRCTNNYDRKNTYVSADIVANGSKLAVVQAELRSDIEPDIDLVLSRRKLITARVTAENGSRSKSLVCLLPRARALTKSLGDLPSADSSSIQVRNVTNGKSTENNSISGIKMSYYRRYVGSRPEPTRHWSQYGDNSDTLEERTSFVYRNGKWVHEPKNASRSPHRPMRRFETEQSCMRGSTSQLNLIPTSTSNNTSASHSKVTKSTSFDGFATGSASLGRTQQGKTAKQHGLLDYAKRKWNNFVDQIKITTPSTDDNSSKTPDLPAKVPNASPQRAKSGSPLIDKPEIPRRNQECAPDVPPRIFPKSVRSPTAALDSATLDEVSSNHTICPTLYDSDVDDTCPTRPSRPKRDASKTKSSDLPTKISCIKENQSEVKRESSKAYVSDALSKFDKLLQSFQKNSEDKRDEIYTTISEVGQLSENKPERGPDSTPSTDLAARRLSTKSSHDIGTEKPKPFVKPLLDRVKEYTRKISENATSKIDKKDTDNKYKHEVDKTHGEYYRSYGMQTRTSDIMNIQQPGDARDLRRDKFDNSENVRLEPRANNAGDNNAYNTVHAKPATLPSDESLSCIQSVGRYPSRASIGNNSFEILDNNKYLDYQVSTGNRGVCENKEHHIEDGRGHPCQEFKLSTALSDPIAGNIGAMNGRSQTRNDGHIELHIQEDDEPTTSSSEFVNVSRHTGYKSRKVRSIGPGGEYRETKESTSSQSQTRKLSRTDETGKLQVFKERQANAQHRSELVMGNHNGIERASLVQLDQAAGERQLTVTDGNSMSVKTQQCAAERLVGETATVGRESLQVTRTVSGSEAVVEKHTHTSPEKAAVLEKAVVKIPNAGRFTSSRRRSSHETPPPSSSNSGADTTNKPSTPLGSRYRVSTMSYAAETKTETIDVPFNSNSAISETDRAVLLAAIDGRLREKEAELFNPNAADNCAINSSSTLQNTSLAMTSQKTSLPSREEEEALARARILAQARAGMGGRTNLRKRNLIVDEEMMEVLFLRCIICQDRYDTDDRAPKLLPCHHTFCLHCLKEMFRVEAEHRQSLTSAFQEMPTFVSINCPTCRENHMINDSNYRDLKSDQKVLELLEISTIPPRERVGYCKKHRTQPLDFFCESCVQSICSDCRVLDHSERDEHLVHDREAALRLYARDVGSTISKAETEEQILEEIEKKIETTIENVETKLTETMDNIQGIFEKFRANINSRQDLLLGRLRDEIDEKVEKYSTDLDAITQRVDALAATRACLVQAKDDEDVEQMFIKQKTGSDMLSDPLDLISDPYSAPKASFVYEKRDRANVMSTISDHGILMFES